MSNSKPQLNNAKKHVLENETQIDSINSQPDFSKRLETITKMIEVSLQELRLISHQIVISELHQSNLEKGIDLSAVIDSVEAHLITLTLEKTGGNQTLASGLLGVRLSTLNSKIRRFGLLPNRFRRAT